MRYSMNDVNTIYGIFLVQKKVDISGGIPYTVFGHIKKYIM